LAIALFAGVLVRTCRTRVPPNERRSSSSLPATEGGQVPPTRDPKAEDGDSKRIAPTADELREKVDQSRKVITRSLDLLGNLLSISGDDLAALAKAIDGADAREAAEAAERLRARIAELGKALSEVDDEASRIARRSEEYLKSGGATPVRAQGLADDVKAPLDSISTRCLEVGKALDEAQHLLARKDNAWITSLTLLTSELRRARDVLTQASVKLSAAISVLESFEP